MALIHSLSKVERDRQSVHQPVECGYSMFTRDGLTYLQLDTYGSPGRQIPGKTSQSVQLDRSAAVDLKKLIEQAFPGV